MSLPTRQSAGRRLACSGRARSVLDHIDIVEASAKRQTVTLTLPLSPHFMAKFVYSHPMTPTEWRQLNTLLEVMGPGMVQEVPHGYR